MHLRRLNLVNEMVPSPEEVKSADHDSPPNFFAAPKTTEGTATAGESADGGNARSNGGQSGVVIAIAVCFILLALILVCKNRARRDSLHSGQQRSIHHRGNKKKVAPLPMPPVEPQVAAIANGGDDNMVSTNNAVDDEEQPQVNEEPQAREEDETEVDSIANNVHIGTLTAIPE